MRSRPCTVGKGIIPIHTVFYKLGNPIGKPEKGGQLTVLNLVKYLYLCLVPIGEDSDIVFYLVTKSNKGHNTPTKVRRNKAVMKINTPQYPKVRVPSPRHHAFENTK
jgi:hypothetical protein